MGNFIDIKTLLPQELRGPISTKQKMFIIPAIKQAALGLEEESILGTMHLNALNGSSDVLGSSSSGCFGGAMMPGTTSSPTTSCAALSTPTYSGLGSRGRSPRRVEVFGGLFGACVSDNHPYRPHDSGTASLFREDPSKSPTATAVVNAGLATAGTSQFVSPDKLPASMDPDARSCRHSGAARAENTTARKSGETRGRHKKRTQKLHHQTRVDDENNLAQPGDNYAQDIYGIKIDNFTDSYRSRNEEQYICGDVSCPSPSHPISSRLVDVEERLRESQMLILERETERKRRGKGREPRRHSLDLDLSMTSPPLLMSSSSRKDGRIKSANRGRNSIPSELELALHSARPGCRHNRDADLDKDDLTLSISEVREQNYYYNYYYYYYYYYYYHLLLLY